MSDKILNLAKELNFTIKTENCCRTFGPRKDVSSFRPEKGCEVFVGRISNDAYEDEIYDLFSRAGFIYKIKLMLNLNGTTKGYCFVEFFFNGFARKAIEMFNGYEFRGRRLFVDMSTNHCNLVVTGVQVSQNRLLEDIKIKIKDYDVVITRRGLETYLLQFSEHRFAQLTLKNFSSLQELWGASATISWQPNEEVKRRLKAKSEFRRRPTISINIPTTAPTGVLTPDSGLASDGSNNNYSSPEDGAAAMANFASDARATKSFLEDVETCPSGAAGMESCGVPDFHIPPPGFPYEDQFASCFTPDLLLTMVQQPKPDIYGYFGPSTSSGHAFKLAGEPWFQQTTSTGQAVTKSNRAEPAVGSASDTDLQKEMEDYLNTIVDIQAEDLPKEIQPENDVNVVVEKLLEVHRELCEDPQTQSAASYILRFIMDLQINEGDAAAATSASPAGPPAVASSVAAAAPVNNNVPYAYKGLEKIWQKPTEDDFNRHFSRAIENGQDIVKELNDMYFYYTSPCSTIRRADAMPILEDKDKE